MSDRWWTSRKMVLRAINAPHVEIQKNLNEIQNHHLLAHLMNQLQQSIRGTIKQKYREAVSGIRFMNEIIISTHKR